MKQIFLIYSVQENQTQKTLNFFLSATCSTEEKRKGRTRQSTTNTQMVEANLPRLSLSFPLLSVSPHFFSISASFYNATRKGKKSLQGFEVTPGNSMRESFAPTDTIQFRALSTIQSIVFNFS